MWHNILLSTLRLGVLTCLDGYMNIVLGQTEEYLNGQVYIPTFVS